MAYKDKEKARQHWREYYKQHKEKWAFYQQKTKEHRQKQARERGQKLKKEVLIYYSQGTIKCARCSIDDIDVLCIDHIAGGGNKKKGVYLRGGANFYHWLKENGLPEGYQVLCFNCNFKKSLYEDKWGER